MNDSQSKTAGSEVEREAFEAWAEDQGFALQRVVRGDDYQDLRTQGPWDAWQARATLSHPATQAGAVQAVGNLDSPAYDAYFGQVRKYTDSLPRYIIWDSKHPDYPVEWTNPGRPTSEDEHGFFRHDIVNELMAEAKEEGRREAAQSGYGAALNRALTEYDAHLKTPLPATQPNAAPAAEVVAPRQGSFLMKRIDAAAEALSEAMAFTKLTEPLATKVEHALSGLRGIQANAVPTTGQGNAGAVAWEYQNMGERKFLTHTDPAGWHPHDREGFQHFRALGYLAAPGAAIDAREQEALSAIAAEFREAIPTRDGAVLAAMIEEGVTVLGSHIRYALASRSEAPATRPNAAGQEQGWPEHHTCEESSECAACDRAAKPLTALQFVEWIEAQDPDREPLTLRETLAAATASTPVASSGMTADKEGV